tara:strand:+ start:332 stop:625 length:294 start_codon:yes stop_codon:yes gene_type:complete
MCEYFRFRLHPLNVIFANEFVSKKRKLQSVRAYREKKERGQTESNSREEEGQNGDERDVFASFCRINAKRSFIVVDNIARCNRFFFIYVIEWFRARE